MKGKNFLVKTSGVKRNLLLTVMMLFLCVSAFSFPVSARESVTLHDFLGYYLCGVADSGEYGNPEVFSLYLNKEGNLERNSGMFYATVESSTRYEYTEISLKGDTLTCNYNRAYGVYEIRDGGRPGMHTFTLREDGNIESDGEVWYRYERQEEEVTPKSKVLRTVTDVDFADGDFSKKASFFGVESVKRSQIITVTFLDTLEDRPYQTWDVSAAQDGSVLLWFDRADGAVFIAAEGGVKANPDSSSLFRECTQLDEVNFGENFDVSDVVDFSYLFCGCNALTALDGVNGWNTGKAYDMRAMFRGCSALEYLNANFLTIDNVTNLSEIFRDCSELLELHTEYWHYCEALTADDAFTGTKWEGSSPLLETRGTDVKLGCILNTEILQDRLRLRAQLLMAYDDILENYWRNPTFYCLKDLNGDEIPELIVRENVESEDIYTFMVYVFDPVSCRAKKAGDSVTSNWPTVYLYPNEQVISYTYSGGQGGIAIEKSRAYTIWESELPDTERENLDFTYTEWEKIGSHTFRFTDAQTGEEAEKDASIYASKNSSGNYNYLAIYVDGHKVYRKALSGTHSQIEKDIFWTPGENGEKIYNVYLHVGGEGTSEYTALLEYRDDAFEEIFRLEDAIEEQQLFGENYFKIPEIEGSYLKVTFCVNTYVLGKELEFSIGFAKGTYDLKQWSFVSEIEHTWSQSCNVMADETFDAYTTVRGDTVAFTVNKGDVVQYDKIWLSDGLIWVRIRNMSAEEGWIPAGMEPVFEELSRYAKDEEEDWETQLDYYQRHFEMKIPGDLQLYELARYYDTSWHDDIDEEDYVAIYYGLIGSSSDHYEEAQGYLEAWAAYQRGEEYNPESEENANSEEDPTASPGTDSGDAPENELETGSENSSGDTEKWNEMDVYSQYLQENWLEKEVSCQSLDLDNDGAEELLIHYNNTDANCEIYKADAASGEIRYIGQIAYVHYDLYWSEKYEELVQFSRSAGSETYSFYRFENGALEFDFGVSWMEVNNVDKRITGYSYFSDDDRHELGRYEVAANEEEDPQAKVEASKEYRAYLEDMVLIEFSPVLDFIWKKEGIMQDESAAPAEDSMEENGENAEVQQEGDSTVSEENQADEKNVPDETADSEYIISDSNSRYLSSDEVDSFDSEKVRMAINELYARHGRVFATPEIAAYFQSKSWYQPDESKTDAQIVAEFNEYEKANAELLLTCQS